MTISGAKDPYRRTDQADITIFGTNGTVTAKGDSFMSIINSGLTSEGRDKSEQILSTFFFFPNFSLSENRIHQNYAGLLPSGWTGSEYADGFGKSLVVGDFNGDQSIDFATGVSSKILAPLAIMASALALLEIFSRSSYDSLSFKLI